MKITVYKSEAKGKVNAPPSKSLTIRTLMCAALSQGMSEIVQPLVSEDTDAAAAVLGQVGVTIKKEADLWRVTGGNLQSSPQDIFCGESAATLRFMTAIAALIPGRHRLTGGPSLTKRPVKPLADALKQLGINVSATGKGTPPVTVEGGILKGEVAELPGNISSQFISALLLIAPFAERGMTVRLTTPLTSKPYIDMTLWCLQQFGIKVQASANNYIVLAQRYQPARLEIEGDWSSASYFLALGAVSQGIEVGNLNPDSLQGDRVIIDFLRDMGAKIKVSGNAITVSRGKLRGINANLADCIDLLPTMAVLAALAKGRSEFTGIGRASLKESDRVTAVRNNLQKMGVEVLAARDSLIINSPAEAGPKPAAIDSYGDHRIAMAFGVLGAAVSGVTITGAESVAKTFPTYWDLLKKVGVRMETHAE